MHVVYFYNTVVIRLLFNELVNVLNLVFFSGTQLGKQSAKWQMIWRAVIKAQPGLLERSSV